MKIDVQPGTVVVFTDVVCGWSTVALHRFYAAREKAGLTDAVRVDHQLFLLEDVNEFPIPKRYLDSEIPVVGALAPEFGWKPWQGDASTWPITSLLTNEAVHAAKRQSLPAAERLDMALRHAFFTDSRPVSLLHEIIGVAQRCSGVDAGALRRDLEQGTARAEMMRGYRDHRDEVQGSPHFFLPDGSDVHNPGIELHWVGEPGAGFPVVDSDDPAAMDELVKRAAG
ncbi:MULTISPECIES: DsbA family oxidoreductase [Mycolicibacterium]|uniref:DSBA-like thioredoxin domain n=1 Tax=Mycolicibacterium senegalense TaxID=1796 RepID=A0A378W7G7_9MYCO|nr:MULTISPECIES: DsbA family protein [Mycolicibacterium]MCV7338226.1 DsbA family protein [Mycolicibacterium senegalense]MDR7287406.1 putative DsbA family dithiol-disulfide isomerase [Mycolicibacterium senegalense]QZA24469.1 DsbA family protein [Mycolicibacterium senegalense]CDP87441.1 DSBA-like thioredoxin domain protein [Mycolicibacterium farcinogenes]SUA29015.1 DSBA-like thioredoxin domain [Mycolicibacterium senegalense]